MQQQRLLVGLGFLALIGFSDLAEAQQRGTIRGTVVEQATQRPLAGAQVMVAGTNLGTLTNQQGHYLIANVPPGTREVRVTLIGYGSGSRTLDVAAGATATVDFALAQTAVAIEGVVVSATGALQRRREIGNTVGSIEVAEQVELATVNKMSDVLQGRVPGVTVLQSGGTTGTGSRVRIRGSNSVSLSNEPLLIIDGIRVNNAPQSSSIAVGGQTPSRLEDINPDDIESIEILKGPAAAAAYGTAAANGVIQITTRRGRAGPARWNFYTEQGAVQERNAWPGNFRQLGTGPAGEFRNCLVFQAAAGACTPVADSLLVWNPLRDRSSNRGGLGISTPELGGASPFRDGHRQKYGLNVAGGGEVATYFLSAEYEDEQGIYDPNQLRRVFLRANVSTRPTSSLDISVNTGYVSSQLGFPQNDNNSLGFASAGLLGTFRDNPDTRGYFGNRPPSQLFFQEVGQDVERYTGSLTANYRPFAFLSLTAQTGLDFVNRHDDSFVPPNRIFSGDLPQGFRASNRAQFGTYTANVSATGNFVLTPVLTSTTTAGVQYNRETFQRTDASGWQLLEGTRNLQGANARFQVSEFWTDNILIGGLVSQQFGINDRVFVTGSLRGDDNSAFGQDFGFVFYPSASVSWVIGEESWFPQTDVLTSLRLRAAAGQSGLRPGFRDALTFFSPVAVTVEGRDAPGFTVGGTGNPVLRPERSTEYEVGFEAGLWRERLGVEFTVFDKRTRDALVARRLAPSLGQAQEQFVNVGEVSNRGIEALVNAQILDLPEIRWDVTLTGSSSRNRLRTLGEGVDPIIFGLGGNSQRHQPGFPLGGYWAEPMSFEDRDGNGLISADEITIAAEQEFRGTPFPTRQISVNTATTLFNFLRVSALFDHQGGHKLYNATEEFRCGLTATCRGINDPNAPLHEQARAVASFEFENIDGFIEDASFVKLRELAVTLMAPAQLAERWGLRDLSLTLSGRNLRTWTSYTGMDPEVNFAGQANFGTADFLTQPPVRFFTARVNVGL
jgi:TonB-dependent starch-binding outer membrane protein SusC